MQRGLIHQTVPELLLDSLDKALGDTGPFTRTQLALTDKHHTEIVQSYWQDLLTSAAREQGVTPPVFGDKIKYMKVAEGDQLFGEKYWPTKLDGEAVKRERRVIANESLRMYNIKDDYFSHVATKYEKENTRPK